MKRLASILLFACLTISSSFAQAPPPKKWTGEFGMYGATNFVPGVLIDDEKFTYSQGEVFGKATRNFGKFSLTGDLKGTTSYHVTHQESISGESTTGNVMLMDIEQLYVDISAIEAKNLTLKGGLEAIWTPNKADKWTAFYKFSFIKDTPEKSNMTTGNLMDSLSILFSYTSQDVNQNKKDHDAGLNFLHKFDKPGRELSAKLGARFQDDSNQTEWALGRYVDEKEVIDKIYRLTPRNEDNFYVASAKYQDKNFLDVDKLDADFTLTAELKNDRDHLSAANKINEEWTDSTSYRANFLFYALTVAPRVHVVYSSGQMKYDMAYTPQYYTRKLNDDDHFGDFRDGMISHLFDLNAECRPDQWNKVKLRMERSVAYPNYEQVCWFKRTGAFNNEIYEGNPDLLPSATYKFTLSYDYAASHFSGGFDVSLNDQMRKIEKTFHSETINGNSYRVFSWINAGHSNTFNTKIRLKWTAARLKANFTGNYNYFYGVTDNGKETRNSDFNVNGDVTFTPKGWLFQAKARYQSKIIRSYSSITAVVGCDVRVEKKLGRFTIYYEGRDLLDRDVTTEIYSEDYTHARITNVSNNRRLFLLGVIYKL